MRAGLNTRKLASLVMIAALLAPMVLALVPINVRAQENPVIVFDMSHGQYSSYVTPNEDTDLKEALEADGFDVVWAWGGLNDSILANADGLIVGSIYGENNGFAAAEITAVADWFNAGNKYMFVGSDSDYDGNYLPANASALLAAVNSHVYPEPSQVSDAESNCNASYRVVANGTGDDPYIADIVNGVGKVLMHGPTLLYGSTTGDGAGGVDLLTTSIANVYPVLLYSEAAVVADQDLIPPIAHADEQTGPFVAMTVEVYAGLAGTGVLMVAGASPYGDYKPMYADEYYDVVLTGNLLVEQAINWGMDTAPTLQAFDMMLILGIVGVVVVVIIIVAVFMKRK